MRANSLSEIMRASSQLAWCYLLLITDPGNVNAFHGELQILPKYRCPFFFSSCQVLSSLGALRINKHLALHCLNCGKCRHSTQVSGCALALVIVKLERTFLQIRPSYNHLPDYQGNVTLAIVTLVTEGNHQKM